MPTLVQGRSSRSGGVVGNIFSIFWSRITGKQEHASPSRRSGKLDGVAHYTTVCLTPDGCVESQDPLAVPGAPPLSPEALPPSTDLRLPIAPVSSAIPGQPSSDEAANAVHRQATHAGMVAGAVVSSFVGLTLILLLIFFYLRHRRKTHRAPSDEFLRPRRDPERPTISFPRAISQYDIDAHAYPALTVPPPPYIRGSYSQPIFTKPTH